MNKCSLCPQLIFKDWSTTKCGKTLCRECTDKVKEENETRAQVVTAFLKECEELLDDDAIYELAKAYCVSHTQLCGLYEELIDRAYFTGNDTLEEYRGEK